MSVTFSLDTRGLFSPRKVSVPSPEDGLFFKGNNGALVILIHGLTGTPNEMKFLANFLNRKGYSVICPRLANHTEPIYVLKMTRWQDIYGGLRQVMLKGEAAEFDGPVFVSGLSMGAIFALLLGNEFKKKINGVSCLAPTLFYDGWNSPSVKFIMPIACKTPIKYFYYFKEEPPYGVKNEAIRERIHRYYQNASLDDMDNVAQYGYPYFPAALLYEVDLLARHARKKLSGIDFPVQLIQAKDDDVASVRNSKFIYDRIKSEMKEMILLYDSYHVITADHERYIVAEKVVEFFNRIRGR